MFYSNSFEASHATALSKLLQFQHTRLDRIPGQVSDTVITLEMFSKCYPTIDGPAQIHQFVSENFVDPLTGKHSGLHSVQYRTDDVLVDARSADSKIGANGGSSNYQVGRFMGGVRHQNMALKYVVGFPSRWWAITHLVLMGVIARGHHEIGTAEARSLLLGKLFDNPPVANKDGIVFSPVKYKIQPSKTKCDHCWLYFVRVEKRIYIAIALNTNDKGSCNYEKENEFVLLDYGQY